MARTVSPGTWRRCRCGTGRGSEPEEVPGLRTGNRRDSGITVVATAIWVLALLGITAMAVEVARLTTTATEVQVAADAAALAAALAISQGQSAQAVSMGQSVAAANSSDGRAVDISGVQIDIGNYNSDPAANPHFTASCTAGVDCNAAKATVTVSNVKYIIASILSGQTGTDVQKTAVAAIHCQGGATPFPLAICEDALTEIPDDSLCGALSSSINIKPDLAQNGCWTSLSSASSSASFVQSIFPAQCGGTPLYTSLGQNIDLHGGLSDDVFKALQCCIQCQNVHDYTVPVISCTGTCSGAPPVVGFATLHIANAADVSRATNGNTNCNSFAFCPNGVQVPNAGISQLQGSQVCKSDLRGPPGGTNCTNFANTVAPVLGQLP
jgi:Flp pilus assembly protein TadG